MEFFLCHCVALLWEFLELLSLLLSHCILDLWFHIHVSLSSNTLMSKLISLTRSLHPLSMASFSAILRALFFSSKSLQTFPNFFYCTMLGLCYNFPLSSKHQCLLPTRLMPATMSLQFLHCDCLTDTSPKFTQSHGMVIQTPKFTPSLVSLESL